MKTHLIINNIRATVFLPILQCNWELLNKLQEIIPQILPSLTYDKPLMIGDSILPPGSWMASTPTGDLRIFVQPQKVDFINYSMVENENSAKHWEIFCKRSIEIFRVFMDALKVDASRIAIAPTYIYRDGLDNWKDFIKESFRKDSFRDAEIDAGDFSQTFRVKESLSDKNYRYNFLSKFYSTNTMVFKDFQNVLEEVPTIEFDINTANDQGYSFNSQVIESFFNNASKYANEFLLQYFD